MLMIEVYSPSVDMSYDFQISENASTEEAIRSFCEIIARKNGCEYNGVAEKSALYDLKHENELNKSYTLKENKVVSGMRLMLV